MGRNVTKTSHIQNRMKGRKGGVTSKGEHSLGIDVDCHCSNTLQAYDAGIAQINFVMWKNLVTEFK